VAQPSRARDWPVTGQRPASDRPRRPPGATCAYTAV